MNCAYCGTEIPFDERFCRNCGRAAVAPSSSRNAPTVPFSVPPNTVPYNPYGPTAENSSPPFSQIPQTPATVESRSPLLFRITIASIIVAFVAIGVLAYFLITRSKSDGQEVGVNEKPTPVASPSSTSSNATPTPTTQSTTTPTPASSPTPKPTPNNDPPPGARLAYCNDTNVLVRNAPDLNARPTTKITRGQNIWVIGSSSNYSTWKGITSNWTQVQLYKGPTRGWVFTPFVSYATEKD